MKIFYINLDKDRERRESMERQLSSLGLCYERMQAVYGRELSQETLQECYSRKRVFRCQSRELTFAEIGIALSHINIYRRIIDQNIPCALVLEDDVIFPDRFGEAINDLEPLVGVDRPEVLLLSPATADFGQPGKIRTSGEYQAVPFVSGFYASSYIVTRSAAESLLKELYPLSMYADNWNRLKTFKVVDIYVISPCLLEQDREQFGSATDADHRPFPNLFAKLIYKLRRTRCVILDIFAAAWRRKYHPYNDVLKINR